MSCPHLSISFGLILGAAAVLALPAPARAGPIEDIPKERQCLWQLIEGTGPQIDCIHPAWFTAEERADVERLTRGYLKDARCVVTVKIARAEIDKALAATDLVFQSPPQPVSCDLETNRGNFTITGTFSPRVVFKDGVAIEGSPGLADVKGINSYLVWPVVHYINFADRITKSMLLMINAYRSYRGPKP